MSELPDDGEFLPPTEFARNLRNNHTHAEVALWQSLKGSKTGFKFTRQARIGCYFADFCCRQRRLVVEVDGDSHERRLEEDDARDRAFRDRGYEVTAIHK